MKRFFIILFIVGFVLAICLAGVCDSETIKGEKLITNMTFWTIAITALTLSTVGTMGFLIIKSEEERYGTIYQKKTANPCTVGNTYYTRATGTYLEPKERSAS